MLPRLVPLLLLALPLAGCLSGHGSTAPAATVDETPPSPETLVVNATTQTVTPAEVPKVEPLAWEGRIGRGYCAPSGPDACSGMSLDDDRRLELDGRVTRFDATLTWTPAAPTTQELAFGLVLLKSCGAGCFETTPFGDPVRGASPLALSDVPVLLAPDERLGVYVSEPEPCKEVAVVHACASPVEQAFKVEGTLVVLEGRDGAAAAGAGA